MYGDFPSGQGSQAIWKEAYLGSVSSSVAIVRLCGTVERMRVDWWRFECVALCRGTVLMVLGSNRLFRRWIVMKWVVSGLFKYTSTLNWWCSLQGTFAIINTTSKISSYRTFRNLGLRGPAFYHCLTMQWMLCSYEWAWLLSQLSSIAAAAIENIVSMNRIEGKIYKSRAYICFVARDISKGG